MRHVLALMLLLGAMIGLLGQQTAAATVPGATVASAGATGADCMKMTGEHSGKPDKKHCAGLTLDCIFAMGCAMPLGHAPIAPIAAAPMPAARLFWTTTAVLHGTNPVPEPNPPTILG